MSAQVVETSCPEDGQAGLLTTDEAAAVLGLPPMSVAAIAARGGIRGLKVARRWLLERDSVLSYAEHRRGRPGRRHGSAGSTAKRLPAAPLLRQIELRGGDDALGARPGSADRRAVDKARRCGSLTIRTADVLACRLLAMHPYELWGDEFGA